MSKNIDEQYQNLLQTILDFGVTKQDRTGTGTKSIFGYTIRHNMREGFPLLTTKKMYFKGVVTELLWFLRGDTNIKFLVDNSCHIWDGDAYKRYAKHFASVNFPYLSKEEFINKIKIDDEFAKAWGELGPIYGKQWRNWERYDEIGQHYSSKTQKIEKSDILRRKPIDQIANLISELKTNPDSRRLMVNAWNVGDLNQMVLPPCHYGFQVYTRELSLDERCKLANFAPFDDRFPEDDSPFKWDEHTIKIANDWLEQHHQNLPTRAISLMWNQRSVDVPLGLPFNIASYALLLEIIAKVVNMIPDQLIGNLGDTHIYLNQEEGVREQLTREPFSLPSLKMSKSLDFSKGIDHVLETCSMTDFQIEGYDSHSTIKFPLSN